MKKTIWFFIQNVNTCPLPGIFKDVCMYVEYIFLTEYLVNIDRKLKTSFNKDEFKNM